MAVSGETVESHAHGSPLSQAESPAVIAHINLLQGIINRLATNGSSCKTWCLALVGELLSLAGAARAPLIVTSTLVPIVIFGYLDTRYLAQERAYRKLYDHIVTAVRSGRYDLSLAFEAKARVGFCDFLCALFSWSVLPVYLCLAAVYAAAHYQGWLALLAAAPKPAS